MNRLGFLVFFYKLQKILACDGIASCLLPAVLIFEKTDFDIEPCGQLADRRICSIDSVAGRFSNSNS